MILHLHGSLGDHVIATGLPEAYFNLTGEKTYIKTERAGGNPVYWEDNPHVLKQPTGEYKSLGFNTYPKDYMIYTPVRMFYDISGYIVDRSEVRPNLYKERHPEKDLIVINDQAGWPSRRGYPYLDELVHELLDKGWKICYMRNDEFADCFGQRSPRQLTRYTFEVQPTLRQGVETLQSAAIYIGYDSGYAQISGALGVPYIVMSGPIAPISSIHGSCIYAFNIPGCRRCCANSCPNNCLQNISNRNEEIKAAILTSKERK